MLIGRIQELIETSFVFDCLNVLSGRVWIWLSLIPTGNEYFQSALDGREGRVTRASLLHQRSREGGGGE